ncbi:S8 family serine peptidase [Lentibacillus salicampi]|uniref:Lactocepin n=1 Tax=Lentibacillus salicampi TaxID=175306 RepID=A0A4Y9AJ48_9BACI|nr:S8 family serine peptidase [Lentibacillus salicampi]TFJ94431.1 lactocepin [Lentibacillus salicampi]
MVKRILVVLLAFMLTLSFALPVSAAGITGKTLQENTEKKVNTDTKELEETTDPDEQVRVIVELKEEAPIEKATKKGVTFKSLKPTEKKQMQNQAKKAQKTVKNEMNTEKIEADYLQEFATVVNGFSAEIKQGDIASIENISNVDKVHIVNKYKHPEATPDMKYSKELVQAQETWRDYGYKGEGMTVGIIDTGIDPSHRDMVLSEETNPAHTESSVEETIADQDLPGQFYTEKVPYGYNYMDETDEIIDNAAGASMHGMHVAGTVGANGDEDNGGIMGIAPEAQLLALKVFGNDPEVQFTYGDVYVKAMDDAIKLGVDAFNLSLGSPSAFVNADSPEQQAVKRAVDNGVLVAISAGNSNMFADGFYYPLASNPDYGLPGSPGVAEDSLQVASYENTYMDVDAVDYEIDGTEESAPFLSAGNTLPSDYVKKSFEVVEAGLGAPEDFAGKDVQGKYALVQRGELAFTDKALNAQAAGAEGVIIYNNTDGIVNMATDDAIEIPQLFMLKNDGDKLAKALKDGQDVTLHFNGGTATINNPDAGKMSAFSSWGLTPNLDFKPEITAPGGQILSTLNDDEYGLMSGTSMASPHVAGGGALVMQRIDEAFGLEDANRVSLVKNIMMNTSKLVELDGSYVSPRRQGAGMMQLHAAMASPAVVTDAETNEASVALKQITENKATFELTAKNLSDEAVTYDVKANAQTDQPVVDGADTIVAPNQFAALELDEAATVNGEDVSQIEIPANGETTITVSIDVSDADGQLKEFFTNGYWLEGFVTLTDPNDINPKISVPYAGFKGEWDDAPIMDKPMWDEDTYYGMTGVATSNGTDADGDPQFDFLGQDFETGDMNPENIAFSPDGDGDHDDALLVTSFLRNAKEVKFNVLNEDKEKVRTIATESYMAKSYYDSGAAPMYSLDASRIWDGQLDGEKAPEGTYYLQVEAIIDYEGAEWQSLEIPVKLDTTAPDLDAEFKADSQTVKVDAADNQDGAGLAYWDVRVDGESILDDPYAGDETEHQLTKKLKPGQTLSVVAVDYAGNEAKEVASEGADTTIPELHLQSPEFQGVNTTREVEFSGYVTDQSAIDEVTVDGEQAEVVYNEAEERYDFSVTIDHDHDGYFLKHIKAVDDAGNEAEIGRRYFVDTQKAGLQVDSPEKTEAGSINVSATITDNFDDIRLYVNGSEVYRHDQSEPYGMNGFEETINDIELDLEAGMNEFEFKVVDLGGHVTTKTIEIEQESSIEGMLSLVDEYEADDEIKSSQAARLMTMHLTTVGHFVDSGATDKAVKHMNSFKQMLNQFEKNDQITEDAAAELRTHTDRLLEEWS